MLIAASENTSYFRLRYNGTTVPPTLNVSLTLQSSTILKHRLAQDNIYFFFSLTQEFQTLPPVLKAKVLHQYRDNGHYTGRSIYNVYKTGILYDQLAPYILKH